MIDKDRIPKGLLLTALVDQAISKSAAKAKPEPLNDVVIFKLGKPIPKVWLHMEFDFDDTMKYKDDAIIETEAELKRLTEKYLS